MGEYARFLEIGQRRLPQPPRTGESLAGKRVLVTGGTGCIGTELLRQLARLGCRELACLANRSGPEVEGVRYWRGDIRDIGPLMARGWDAVFHTAAQRDPGLAERQQRLTITTNVFGMAAALASAERHGVERFVYASTGKALRPFSPDTYTATKRVAECLLAQSTIPRRSGARFTHVVDNSIIHERLLRWARAGEPIRLHADGIIFYAQSAIESAQLLIGAAEHAGTGAAEIHAIRDLGIPVDLTEMTAEMIHDLGSSSLIQVVGYDSGYEETPFPGLYDPDTAFDHSPLINAFEADTAHQPYEAVDAFPLRFGRRVEVSGDLEADSWRVMESAVAAVRPELAERIADLARSKCTDPTHSRMLKIIEEQGG